MIANFGSFELILAIGVIFIMLFMGLRFFSCLFSVSFIGFLLSLVSYFVYDYIFYTIPVIAALGFLFSLSGFFKSTFFGKLFAIAGILLSGYILLSNYGLLF